MFRRKTDNRATARSCSYLQLEAVQIVHAGRRREERAERRRGELDEQLGTAGHGRRDALAAAAELQNDRIAGIVAIVNGHVILQLCVCVGVWVLAVFWRASRRRHQNGGCSATACE